MLYNPANIFHHASGRMSYLTIFGPLKYKGRYDAHSRTIKLDPKQVFGLAQKYTLNNHFKLFRWVHFILNKVYPTLLKVIKNILFPDFSCFLTP